MHPQTIFTKTSKGVLEVKNKTIRLSSELGAVFVAVDGKSPFSALAEKTELDENTLQESVEKLLADGYIKIFFQPIVERKSVELEPIPAGSLIDDLDFTSSAKVAELTSEAELRAKAEAAAKARAEAAARGAAEAKARQDAEARARAAAEAKVKQELAAKLKAEEAARAAAQASVKAQSEVESATEAKAKAEAQARVRAAMEAKAKAEAEARARAAAESKAKSEVEVNTKAEAGARAEADARTRTEAEARAAAQAEARARVAVEAKMRAMEQALKEAEAHAKAEAAARAQAQAEAKARAEADAKARAEAEARAKSAEDAVAQARAMAAEAAAEKAEADAKAKSGAASEAASASVVEQAKSAALAREIEIERQEARAKAEAASRALAEAEARAKTEAEARAAAEAKAKEEAERRAQEDLQRKAEIQIAREEAEARTREQMKALEDNIRKSREEAVAREESEKKAREESEARIEVERKARRELEAQMAAERASRDAMVSKAREEAERKAQAEAAATVAAQRQAHEQAAARAQAEATKAQAEAAARLAQAEQKAAAEKLARAAAEDRAKQESIARVMQEHTLKQRSEKEVSSKVEAELRSRQQAELQAEISARVDAQKRAEEAAAKRALQRDQEPDEEAASAPVKKRANLGVMAVIGLFAILGIGLAVLQFMPLSGYIPGVEKLLSDRLHEPVNIFSMRFSLMPSPQIKIERMVIGKAQDVKIESTIIPVSSLAILDEQKNLDEVQLSSITIDQTAIPRLALWAQPQAGESKLHISRVTLTNIKLAGTGSDVPAFQGTVTLGKDGGVQNMQLRDPKLNVELTPGKDGLQVKFNARNWQPPFGIAAEFSSLGGTAVVTKQQMVVSDLDGRLLNGALKGKFTLKWGSGLAADGNFSLNGGDVGPLLAMYTREFVASGSLDMTTQFSTQGKTPDALFDAPRMTSTFSVKNGSINNVDLVRAIQSPSSKAQRGGKSNFGEITGEAQVAANRISYRNLKLVSGPMNGTGNLDVAPTGELSGHLSLVLGSATVTVARGSLNVGGSLKDPQLSSQ